MLENPWQQIDSPNVLFIVDAAHKVEENLLLRWLNQSKLKSGYEGTVSHAVVPIAHNPESIETEGLQMALDVPEDTLVAPVRVVWKTKFDTMHNKPRLRDLLAGNPRRPGEHRARRLLELDADQATPIMGEPATLGDLHSRFKQRQKNIAVDKDLAEFIAGQAGLALEVAERRRRGSRYKVPRQVAKQIRASDRYQKGLLEIAEQTGTT